MSKVIGIDLGTTNSCVAIVVDGKPQVIPNAEGTRTTASVVALTEGGDWLVGQVAKRQAVTNPTRTIWSVKRLIGRKFEADEVQAARRFLPFKVVTAKNGDAWVRIGDRPFSPPEISAHILRKMRETAEDFLGESVTQAVITVPAYFNDSQRQATRDAGRIAGLDVLRIINEPTAAAVSFGLEAEGQSRIAVYDMGGGTFDISILDVGGGVIDVRSTSGDTHLGGEDFDERIVRWLTETFEADEGIDLTADPASLQRVKEASEKAKCDLSSIESVSIDLPFIAAGPAGPVHLSATLTRDMLNELTSDLVERSLEPCQQALDDSGCKASEIEVVLLVGGQTRMPLVKERVTAFFGRAADEVMNPDEVVASGAAIQGGVLRGEVAEVLLIDVTPLTLGLETAGSIFTQVIPRNSSIPCVSSEIYSTSVDNQTMVSVHVLQGERPMAADNFSLARFDLHGIPPAPRGVPQVEVTFNIDANGIVSVTATELGTGKEQQVQVTASGGLSEGEIDDMVEEAESFAGTDALKRELVDLRNHAVSLIYTTERSLGEFETHLGPEAVENLQDEIGYCRNTVDHPGSTAEELKDSIARLESSAHELAEVLYAQFSTDEPGEALEESET